MANKELLETIRKEIVSRIDKRHLSEQAKNELVSILSFLSDLEKSGKPTIQEQPVKTNIVEDLKHYLATTPKEQIEKDWESSKEWDKVGPTVSEFFGWKQPVCEGLEEEHLNPFEFVAGCIDDTLKEKAKEVSANEIEDEINRWMGSTDCLPEDVGITPLPKVMEIVERTARHFAKWGAEHLRPADGKKWIYEDEYKKDLERLFNDGKQAMEEQMMKEAVEIEWESGTMKKGEKEVPFDGGKVKIIIVALEDK